VSRSQLSMELEEGRAAFMLGVPYTSNPYRKPEAQRMARWDEAARNWESGWKAAEGKDEPEKPYSDDFKPCQCGSETFARFEVYAYPPLFDGHKVQLPDSYRCAHCKRPGVRRAAPDA